MSVVSADVELGKVAGVWGVRGWVKVFSYTRNRIEIGDYTHWVLKPEKAHSGNAECSYEVLQCRVQGRGLVAQLEGVNSREAAQSLVDCRIWVKPSQLPSLPDGEYYWQQLIGLSVFWLNSESGEKELIGEVSSIMETGANDVLVIDRAQDQSLDQQDLTKQVLIPFSQTLILEADLEKSTLLVDWNPSYLD